MPRLAPNVSNGGHEDERRERGEHERCTAGPHGPHYVSSKSNPAARFRYSCRPGWRDSKLVGPHSLCAGLLGGLTIWLSQLEGKKWQFWDSFSEMLIRFTSSIDHLITLGA